MRARLRWDGPTPVVDGIPLAPARSVVLVAVGKAAAAMARGALPAAVPVGGVVVSPTPEEPPAPGITMLVGEHPVPGPGSFAAGDAVRAAVAAAGHDAVVLALVSGGASSLVETPAPGIGRDEIRTVTAAMLAGGIPIAAMNGVRIGMSAVKGGRLAAATGARVLTVVVSDVAGDDPALVGSGPTVAGAWDGVAARHLADRLLPGLGARLAAPPPGRDDLPRPVVAASGATAAAAAITWARTNGLAPRPGPALAGPADAAGRTLARIARGLRPGEMVVCHGETTVLVDRPGVGGRNQEAALAAAQELEGGAAVVAFVATDGVDGPTPHAGGLVDGASVVRMRAAGRDPAVDLAGHDATAALAAAGDLITLGPTGTNVGDVAVAFRSV